MVVRRETDKKKKTENLKKPKKDPAILDDVDDDDHDDDDLEYLIEGTKRRQKTALIVKYANVAATGQYATTSEDRKSRMLARQEKIE